MTGEMALACHALSAMNQTGYTNNQKRTNMLVSIPFSTDHFPDSDDDQLIDTVKTYVSLLGDYADEIPTPYKEEAFDWLMQLCQELRRRGRYVLIMRANTYDYLYCITDETPLEVAKSADGAPGYMIVADFHNAVWMSSIQGAAANALADLKRNLYDHSVVTTAYNIGELHDS